MATPYTTVHLVANHLMRNVRIKVDQAEPSSTNDVSISFGQVDQQRQRVEAEITQRLGRFYSTPLALVNSNTIALMERIATDLTSYHCWLMINPNITREALPAGVLEWKKNAEALLDQIVPPGKNSAETGRDIILSGETLTSAAGAAGAAAVVLSRFTPFGGTS